MVSKLPNTIWAKGALVETVKVWQQEWFYITEPRDTNWAAIPDFQIRTTYETHLMDRQGP